MSQPTIQTFLDQYEINRRAVGKRTKSFVPILHQLGQRFGKQITITSENVLQMMADMERTGKKPSTIQAHISFLRAVLRFAKVKDLPDFPSLKFHNARKGFFTQEEFTRIVAHLGEPYADIARMGYSLGWRLSEILMLTWDGVDLQNGIVRLYETKSGEGRIVPLTNGRAGILEHYAKVRGESVYVFHRHGKPISRESYWQEWKKAREAAGLKTKLFHDFRRTFARDSTAAGVDQKTIMQTGGWKTLSVFHRYLITDLEFMRRGLSALDAHRQAA